MPGDAGSQKLEKSYEKYTPAIPTISVFPAFPQKGCIVRALYSSCLAYPGMNRETFKKARTEDKERAPRLLKWWTAKNNKRLVYIDESRRSYLIGRDELGVDAGELVGSLVGKNAIEDFPLQGIFLRDSKTGEARDFLFLEDGVFRSDALALTPKFNTFKTMNSIDSIDYCHNRNKEHCIPPMLRSQTQCGTVISDPQFSGNMTRNPKYLEWERTNGSGHYLVYPHYELFTYPARLFVAASGSQESPLDACEAGIKALQSLSEGFDCMGVHEYAVIINDPAEVLASESTDDDFVDMLQMPQEDDYPRRFLLPVPPTIATNGASLGVKAYLEQFFERLGEPFDPGTFIPSIDLGSSSTELWSLRNVETTSYRRPDAETIKEIARSEYRNRTGDTKTEEPLIFGKWPYVDAHDLNHPAAGPRNNLKARKEIEAKLLLRKAISEATRFQIERYLEYPDKMAEVFAEDTLHSRFFPCSTDPMIRGGVPNGPLGIQTMLRRTSQRHNTTNNSLPPQSTESIRQQF